MTDQLALFPDHKCRPAGKPQDYVLTVRGKKVAVRYEPDWLGVTEFDDGRVHGTQHVEFRTKTPGPISETGYRSHFINGTREELGITKANIKSKLQDLAEALADEYGGKKRGKTTNQKRKG